MSNFISRLLGRTNPSPKQYQFLADSLRGQRPEQPCWANEILRAHVLNSVFERFGDDWNWCLQSVLAIYLINPESLEQIDRILAEHAEARAGSFSPALYSGVGWNPALAVNFDDMSDQFWRCYRANGTDNWSSFEMLLEPASSVDPWKNSGYRLAGRRGCVRHIRLSRSADLENAEECARAFENSALCVLSNALRGADQGALVNAIRQRLPHDGHIGLVRTNFGVSSYREPRSSAKQVFNLTLEHA